MTRFEGFGDPTGRFWKQLAMKQDREFYEANKEAFKRDWEGPMKALLADAAEALRKTYDGLPIAAPKVFRLHRDVRFSKDKTPYKTSLGGCLFLEHGGGAMESPSPLYVQVGLDPMVGVGLYAMQPAQLEAYRAAVLDDARGAALQKLVKKLEGAGWSLDRSLSLARAPKGIDPAHPRIELLRQKGFALMAPALSKDEKKLLGGRAWLDLLVARAKEAAPVVKWLAKAVG
jgi:uncharacterized protein (TIGR02453 family)